MPGKTRDRLGSSPAELRVLACRRGPRRMWAGWSLTRIGVKDVLLDAQTLRTVGSAPYGGADVGECLAAAARVRGTDLTSWHDAWVSAAAATLALAEGELAAGRTETARLAFWRSSSYFRTAGVMLMGSPPDPRLVDTNLRQTDAFRRGAALLAMPPEIVQIPYEGTTLPGYFFRAGDGQRPRATVILTGGYDGTAEELYFFNGAAALARGYHVLAFDGPGQGAALLQQGLILRPDWENVVTPVVDCLLSRAEVDASKIALIGLSLASWERERWIASASELSVQGSVGCSHSTLGAAAAWLRTAPRVPLMTGSSDIGGSAGWWLCGDERDEDVVDDLAQDVVGDGFERHHHLVTEEVEGEIDDPGSEAVRVDLPSLDGAVDDLLDGGAALAEERVA